jgi:hypothetical protein
LRTVATSTGEPTRVTTSPRRLWTPGGGASDARRRLVLPAADVSVRQCPHCPQPTHPTPSSGRSGLPPPTCRASDAAAAPSAAHPPLRHKPLPQRPTMPTTSHTAASTPSNTPRHAPGRHAPPTQCASWHRHRIATRHQLPPAFADPETPPPEAATTGESRRELTEPHREAPATHPTRRARSAAPLGRTCLDRLAPAFWNRPGGRHLRHRHRRGIPAMRRCFL